MDEAIDRQLAEQEQSLRLVIATLAQAKARLPRVVPGPEWIGPARTAYEGTVERLRAELAAVEHRLDAALRHTRLAITTRGR